MPIFITFTDLAAYVRALQVLLAVQYLSFRVDGPPQTIIAATMPIACDIVHILTSNGIVCFVSHPNGVVQHTR